MAALTNEAENRIQDHLKRGQPLSLPASWHVALFTSATSEAGGGTEVSGGSYARVAVARSLSAWSGTQGAGTTTASSGTGGRVSNNAPIVFPAATANWGTITHVALFDAATGGTMWYQGALAAPIVINSGMVFEMLADQLATTLA
jgi:hypothetical protein